MTKTFQLLLILTGHCTKVRTLFELQIFFPYYLSSPLLSQHKNFNFKAHFLFSKKCKGGTMTKFFATPANFNGPLSQSQIFFRTSNIFPYYLSSLLFSQHKNFDFKAHFLFSKKCKGGTMTKFFATPANFNGPLCQIQIFFRTSNLFSILFEFPTIESAQQFQF